MLTETMIPDLDMTAREAYALATANGMYLIARGARFLISPTIPEGWRECFAHPKQQEAA